MAFLENQQIVYAGTPLGDSIRVFCDNEEVGHFGNCALISSEPNQSIDGWIDLHMLKNGVAIGWIENREPQWLMYRRFGKIRWEYANG